MSEQTDMIGLTFGLLYVNEECGRTKDGKVLYRCTCSCGNEVVVRGSDLRQEKIRSCGCLRRAKTIERNTKHGVAKSNPRLYMSVHNHFQYIRKCLSGYQNWTLDARYSDDAEGVVEFCHDLIALQPDACARYETDRTFDLDKDDDAESIFRPESIVFRLASENRSKQYNNLRLDDGCSLVNFCHQVGLPTRENGQKSQVYSMISSYYRYSHKAHPELVKAANQTILEMRQCLELLRLLDDVRAFKAQYLIH